VSHIRSRQGYIDRQRVFGRTAGLVGRKGAMYPLSIRRFDPVEGHMESDNDPNCALCDCRVSGGPLPS